MEAALDLASNGICVFPLRWVDAGRCTCWKADTCDSPGKHPLTTNGVKGATTDRAQVEQWWRTWPNANIGIATGRGLLVLDVDEPEGEESLRTLEGQHGPLPVTVETRTGRGRQLYFKGDTANSAGRLGKNLDVRGSGGYVVAPPSHHVSGKDYEWITNGLTFDALPSAPVWLVEANATAERRTSGAAVPTGLREGVIGEGTRNATLASHAGAMRWRGMSHPSIEAALLAENAASCKPPLSELEVCGIARSVSRYEPGDSVPVPNPRVGTGNGNPVQRPLQFELLADVVADVPDEQEWNWEGFVGPGVVTLIAGKPKVGKSTLVFGLMKALATGEPFLGLSTRPGRALYLTEERPQTLSEKTQRFGLESSDARVLMVHQARTHSWPEVVAEALAHAREHGIKNIFVDPWDKWPDFRGEGENSSGDTIANLQPLLDAAAAGFAIVIVAHQRKSAGTDGDAVRGSNALIGAADVIVELERTRGLDDEANLRVLKTHSRFESTPEKLAIVLDGDCYTAQDLDIAASKAELERVRAALTDECVDHAAIKERVGGMRRESLNRHLSALVAGGIAERHGSGSKGDPYLWRRSPVEDVR